MAQEEGVQVLAMTWKYLGWVWWVMEVLSTAVEGTSAPKEAPTYQISRFLNGMLYISTSS